jgi:hypothetical protein
VEQERSIKNADDLINFIGNQVKEKIKRKALEGQDVFKKISTRLFAKFERRIQ